MTSKIKLEALEDLPEKTSCSHKEERKASALGEEGGQGKKRKDAYNYIKMREASMKYTNNSRPPQNSVV